MKNRIKLLFLFPLLLLLCGCSNSEPVEPSPPVIETPEIITPPPEQPPEPPPEPAPFPEEFVELECNHFWSEADCVSPPRCLYCGEKGGSPNEHEWTAANYQQASVCINCGEVDGTVLKPNFLKLGYRVNTTAGRPYAYKTITNLDETITTTGLAVLLFIDIFESDADHGAKPGYEYIRARLMITFDDENAETNGYQYMTGQLDFYGMDPDEFPVSYEDLEDSDIDGFKTADRMLNYYGEDYKYYMKYELVQNEWIGNIAYVVREYIYLIPAGYDGIIIYLSNAGIWTEDASRSIRDNFDKDTLFFRLFSQTS